MKNKTSVEEPHAAMLLDVNELSAGLQANNILISVSAIFPLPLTASEHTTIPAYYWIFPQIGTFVLDIHAVLTMFTTAQ